MQGRRDTAVRLLRIVFVASIAIPAGVLCWGGWITYNSAFAHADEELRARLDILSEQANAVFETVALNFTSVDTLVGGMTDEQIKASAPACTPSCMRSKRRRRRSAPSGFSTKTAVRS